MTRTPLILRQGWRFHEHLRLPAGGSTVIYLHEADPRLERRRVRPYGYARPVDVYWYDGAPCFSPVEAATKTAIAAGAETMRWRRQEQLDLLA